MSRKKVTKMYVSPYWVYDSAGTPSKYVPKYVAEYVGQPDNTPYNSWSVYPNTLTDIHQYRNYAMYEVGEPVPDLKGYYTVRELTADEVVNIDYDTDTRRKREDYVRAHCFYSVGYRGPVGSGAARGLRIAFREMGYDDCVRKGPCWKMSEVNYGNGLSYTQVKLVNCYQFKSPRPELTWEDFARILKACRKAKGRFAKVVKLIMAMPSEELESLKSSLDTLDVLAGLA